MPTFHVHASSNSFAELESRAQLVENLGFHGLFIADSQLSVLDPFQFVAAASRSTERLLFGTAVTNLVFRDPTVLTGSAATASQISGGRFILGLGTGDGTTYRLGRSPTKIADLERAVTSIRRLLRGGTIESPKGPLSLTVPADVVVPIYISAEGPRGLRVAGRVADGVILGSGFDLDVLRWARSLIEEGAHEVGRDPAQIVLMAAGIISVADDGLAAKRQVKPRLANRAHQNFRFSLETVPEAERPAVRQFLEAFDISKPLENRVPVDIIPEYLVERFSIAGTPDTCAKRVLELQEAGIDQFMLTPPEADWETVIRAWSTEVTPRLMPGTLKPATGRTELS